jgi:hypothetical protein
MKQKYLPIIVIALLITGALLIDITTELIFDQITYSYGSKVWIPPVDPNGSSLGGYYKIKGKGKHFNLFLNLTGAEKSESPLDYTSGGLTGNGTIENIQININTIYALLNHNLKEAMFNTPFKGHMNMTCAAWNGTTQFQNNGQNFTGTFNITGNMTDWEGKFQLTNQGFRIALTSDFTRQYHPDVEAPDHLKHQITKTVYI